MIGMGASIKIFIKYGLLSVQNKLDITDTVFGKVLLAKGLFIP